MRKILNTFHLSAILLTSVPLIVQGNEITGAEIQATKNSETSKEKEELLKLSEGFGHFIGSNLNNPGIPFDLESFIKGIRDGASGKPAPISEQEFEKLMATYQDKAFETLAEENLRDANAFLEDNLDNIDVIEILKGRLQYEVLKQGRGPQVAEDGTPLVHLVGKLIDGTVIISTEASGSPIEIPLDQTIPGLQKGIHNMREGEKRRLYIHPELGAGITDDLPPNTVLIFDVEVVKANNPEGSHFANDEEDPAELTDSLDEEDDLAFSEENEELNVSLNQAKQAIGSRSTEERAPLVSTALHFDGDRLHENGGDANLSNVDEELDLYDPDENDDYQEEIEDFILPPW